MKETFLRNIFYYKSYYLDFYKTLNDDVKKKFNWTLKLLATVERVPIKYLDILRIHPDCMKSE